MPMPASSSRPIVVNEAVVLPSFQPKSRIPDIAATVLPVCSFPKPFLLSSHCVLGSMP